MPVFEDERRRPDWIDGQWVKSEDGQEWSFPLPRIEYRVSMRDASPKKMIESKSETNRKFGDRFWSLEAKLRDRLIPFPSDITHEDYARAIMPMLHDLLSRNYEITIEEIEELFTIVEGDARNQSMWTEIAKMGLGIGPKPVAAS